MRRSRVVGMAGLIAVVGFAASSGAYLSWYSSARNRAFETLRSRSARWGAEVKRSPNFGNTAFGLRGFAPSLFDTLIGTDGYQVRAEGFDATSAQFAELLSIAPIRLLSVAGSPNFSDDCIIGLRSPAAMLGLSLNDVPITDRSAATIARMQDLSTLSLVGTNISDASVANLCKLPNLNGVYVGGPNVAAIRLVDHAIVDESGKPASTACATLRIRGRIAIEGRFGLPGNVRVMVRPEGDPPPWQSHPYGWNASRGSVGLSNREMSGTWTFDIPVGGVPAGRSNVEIWVDQVASGRPSYIHYRLGPFSIDLAQPDESRHSVVEPARAR